MGRRRKGSRRDRVQTLEDLRVAEVVKRDVTIEKGKVTGYRVRFTVSFKCHTSKE